VITRVKLNPEQAVLSCNCYTGGKHVDGSNYWGGTEHYVSCTLRGAGPPDMRSYLVCGGGTEGNLAQGAANTLGAS